jgi:uncharacterized cupin superfamily protein
MYFVKRKKIIHLYPQGKNAETYPYAKSAVIFNSHQLFCSSEILLPGRRASAPHLHKECEEIIYVMRGTLFAIEGTEEISLEAGEAVCFYPHECQLHYVENRSEEEAEFLVIRKALGLSDVVYE